MSKHVPKEEGQPLVALVGRPNVGKSTLFNRLCGGRAALVHDQPGITRDRRYGHATYADLPFRVVDTGGIDEHPDSSNVITMQLIQQALHALAEATVVLFVVDGKAGLLPADLELAQRLRSTHKPVVVVVNKIDNTKEEQACGEFYKLGWSQIFPISADHGRGMPDLLDALYPLLQEASSTQPQTEPQATGSENPLIRVAVVGRPNAGKSSLINALLGEPRMIVTDVPGTTRDAIDTLLVHGNHRYLLIDTAGLRRKARIPEGVEKLSVVMTKKAIDRADVVCLVIDGQTGLAEQDAKIAGLVQEAGKALVLVYNKIDQVPAAKRKKLQEDRERMLPFLFWTRSVECSALKKTGISKILREVNEVYASFCQRVPTGALNRFAEGIVEKHPPPLYRGYPIKIYYITQAQTCPPTFILSVNHPEGLHFSYERYLQNQIRETFGFVGTPIRIIARARRQETK